MDIRGGLPGLDIVGLPDRAVSEAARRVRAAVGNSGFRLPARRITVNLAPADLPKQGAALDLPIAAALLVAAGCVPRQRVDGVGFWGQLSLDGAVRPVPGALPAALALRSSGLAAMVTALADVPAAALSGLDVHGLATLRDLASGQSSQPGGGPEIIAASPPDPGFVESERSFLAVRGQPGASRALLIAAAGEHSTVFFGPPGIGKTLLARAVHALLPPLDRHEALEAAAINSAGGLLFGTFVGGPHAPGPVRPVRTPSTSSGWRAIFGGGQPPRAGEITLAHRGVLVLDELHLYRPEVLSGLAAVMENGSITVRYRGRDLRLPARAQVVGTSNLCACGRTGAVAGGCVCSRAARRAFWRRLSGPLLDRIDLQVEMSDVPACELGLHAARAGPAQGEGRDGLSGARAAVADARARQAARYGPGVTNARADEDVFRSSLKIDQAGLDLLAHAQAALGLSARAYYRTLRVAATAADLGSAGGAVNADHVAEALAYRSRLRPDL